MKKKDTKKIGITIGILLLLIGNVNAEDSVIEDAPNISIGDAMGDTSGSSTIENITLEEGVVNDKNITEGMMPTEKKSSPGFGYIDDNIFIGSYIQ